MPKQTTLPIDDGRPPVVEKSRDYDETTEAAGFRVGDRVRITLEYEAKLRAGGLDEAASTYRAGGVVESIATSTHWTTVTFRLDVPAVHVDGSRREWCHADPDSIERIVATPGEST